MSFFDDNASDDDKHKINYAMRQYFLLKTAETAGEKGLSWLFGSEDLKDEDLKLSIAERKKRLGVEDDASNPFYKSILSGSAFKALKSIDSPVKLADIAPKKTFTFTGSLSDGVRSAVRRRVVGE